MEIDLYAFILIHSVVLLRSVMGSEEIVRNAIYRFAAIWMQVYGGDIKTINVRWITFICLECSAMEGANSTRTYTHTISYVRVYAAVMLQAPESTCHRAHARRAVSLPVFCINSIAAKQTLQLIRHSHPFMSINTLRISVALKNLLLWLALKASSARLPAGLCDSPFKCIVYSYE